MLASSPRLEHARGVSALAEAVALPLLEHTLLGADVLEVVLGLLALFARHGHARKTLEALARGARKNSSRNCDIYANLTNVSRNLPRACI